MIQDLLADWRRIVGWTLVVVVAVGFGLFMKACEETEARDRDRQIRQCLDDGGFPATHGRKGNDVTCYERPTR